MRGEVSKRGLGLRAILILRLTVFALGGFGNIGQVRSGEQTTEPEVSFMEAPGSPIATLPAPSPVIAGDYDEDGHLDLAAICSGKDEEGSVWIFTGKGTGEFSYHASFPSGGNAPAWAASGDFNEDGHLDLAVANSGVDIVTWIFSCEHNNVTVRLGDGAGGFGNPTSYNTGDAPIWMDTGDFNDDGHLDLAVATADGNSITILLNNR